MSPHVGALGWLGDVLRKALFLPEQASALAPRIDALHFFEITTMVGLAVGVAVVVAWWSWRYRRRPERDRGERVHLARWLEIGTYASLLVFFVGLWIVGFRQYVEMQRTGPDTLDVYVTAKQWMWKFAYPEGVGSVGVLYVPAGQPIRLLLTSRDVIHSFYVPAFRLKRDAVPGRYTTIGFEAPEPGRHPILCAEMCGNGHSQMRGEVVVLGPGAWRDWMAKRQEGAVAGPLVERGRRAAARYGCLGCHSVDGSPHIGPTWVGAYGSDVQLRDGSHVRVDDAYLTESMMDPSARLVAGFPNVMPSYQGQIQPPEVAALLEYIRALRDAPDSPEALP